VSAPKKKFRAEFLFKYFQSNYSKKEQITQELFFAPPRAALGRSV
jgi:hypothetical protein